MEAMMPAEHPNARTIGNRVVIVNGLEMPAFFLRPERRPH
jgi:hypothetical protein